MDLSKIQKYIPDFCMDNFHMFNKIVSLKWENASDNAPEVNKKLELVMDSQAGYRLTAELMNVNAFHFGGCGLIEGFYVKDMHNRGYDSAVRFEVGDYEQGDIKLYCSDVIIRAIEKI